MGGNHIKPMELFLILSLQKLCKVTQYLGRENLETDYPDYWGFSPDKDKCPEKIYKINLINKVLYG